jgi:hypothetical protein
LVLLAQPSIWKQQASLGHLKNTYPLICIYIDININYVCVYAYICIDVPPFVSIPRSPKGAGEPYSSSLVRITPTCLDSQGPLGFQGPYTGGFFVPQGTQGPRGTLLVITCSYHPHLSRSQGGPLGFHGPYTGGFFVPQGPLGPRGERPGPCHRETQRLKQTSPSKYGAS